MSSNPAELLIGTAGDLGRSFKVTSVLPSVLLVTYLAALVSTGAFAGEPHVSKVLDAAKGFDFGDAALIVALSLAIGLLLHPLQFALVQLLEGYWGTSPLSQVLMAVRQRSHLKRRRDRLIDEGSAKAEVVRLRSEGASGEEQAAASMHAWNAARGRAVYPESPERVMPTRLGNTLRRYEDLAGSQYGLDSITIAPHLSLLAPPVHLDYLDDTRNQLDSTVRYVVVWILATLATVLCFWPHGLWLTFTLLPYACVVLTYRGAISAAQSYGVALSTIIDLDRHLLYQALRLPLPEDSEIERDLVGPWATNSLQWRKLSFPFEPNSERTPEEA